MWGAEGAALDRAHRRELAATSRLVDTTGKQAMNEDRALEQQFLDRAKALTNVAEVFRCSQVTRLICEMVAFGVRAEAKIFEAAYVEPSGQKYWDAHLSEPIRVYTLAH